MGAEYALTMSEFARDYWSPQSYAEIVENLRNDTQEAIVTAPKERNLLVLAGPGSGKTRVVVHRCAWLLRVARIRPDRVLVICFNRSAMHELRLRLLEVRHRRVDPVPL